MTDVAIVFPHQLFELHPALDSSPHHVVLIEDTLFFGDAEYPARFHKQKLAYHRATMAAWRLAREAEGMHVEIETCDGPQSRLPQIARSIAEGGHDRIVLVDPHDLLLSRRLQAAASAAGLALAIRRSPAFINDPLDNRDYRESKSRWHMADFYAWQRRRLDILMDGDEPVGGRFSFDDENRRKLPRRERALLPSMPDVAENPLIRQAMSSVQEDFPDNPGSLERRFYPVDRAAALGWLDRFLTERFARFGPYEDAIVAGEPWLYHGVLTPMMNVGLLTPQEVVDKALAAASEQQVPHNSVEGFVRQIVGWREFMRATYDDIGTRMRTSNHWSHHRRMPAGFYDATTGIAPVDDVIRRVLETGYCHHIERLMVLGGFMFLCEIEPDDIYTWFMELFIDSYDWVMVPNVYAMSQHADGGSITTKPYFSGSNYVLKMSDHPRADWCATWDALFWRWILLHADALTGNPRWSMMVANARRMPLEKQRAYLQEAERFLASL